MRTAISLLAFVAYFSGLVHLCLLVRRRILRRYGVYILSYHHVVRADGGFGSRHDVTVPQLESHLSFIVKWFHIVPLEHIPALLAAPRLNRDYLVISFDDGYEDNYKQAFPLLRRYGVPATVFLIAGLTGTAGVPWYDECNVYLPFLSREDVSTVELQPLRLVLARLASIMAGRGALEDRIERALTLIKAAAPETRTAILDLLRARYGQAHDRRRVRASSLMNWDQAREMARAGISFGSHTLTHSIFTMLPAPEIERELQTSRAVIEQQLGTPCRTFAFPNGNFDDRSVDLLKRHGVGVACTQVFGVNRPGADPLRLRRIGVGCTPGYVLAAKLSGLFTPAFALRQLCRGWGARGTSSRPLVPGSGYPPQASEGRE